MKKILITGAAGFIGSHLVEHLLNDGVKPKNLKLFVHYKDSLKNLPKKNFEIIKGDICEASIIKKSMKDVDVVYHLAALTLKPEYSEVDYFRVNVEGTKNLLTSAESQKVKKFIFFSSVAVYGLPSCADDIVNFNEMHPKSACEVYGKSKLVGENLVSKSKIPTVIIRPTTVYGPYDHQSFPDLVKSIKNHQFFIIGNGENKLDYVFVKDLVRAARLAEKNKKTKQDYIIGGGAITINEIAKAIPEITKSWILPIHIPKDIAFIISYFTQFLNFPLYPSRVNAMTSNFYFDLSKSKKEIGYVPHFPFKKGSRLAIKWLYDNNRI